MVGAAKHIHGPLEAIGNLIRTEFAHADPDRRGLLVAEVHGPEASAMARQFAAAPDLLRELEHAVRWFDQITPADVARYRAAIAKATGMDGALQVVQALREGEQASRNGSTGGTT